MSNAIGNGIRPPMGNSLSPEPCALIPSWSPIHDRYNKAAREAVDNSRPNVFAVMDGCYADEIGAA